MCSTKCTLGLQMLRVLYITSTGYNNLCTSVLGVPTVRFMGLLSMQMSNPFSVALLFALDASPPVTQGNLSLFRLCLLGA